jgi:type II secretory pathway predicted ATPase ExeA
VWERFWHLTRDPFLAPGSPYVATSGHDEAVARLADAIERSHRLATVHGAAGVGKSAVVSHGVAETRGPLRKFATVHGPPDATALLSGLAEGLGGSVGVAAGRGVAWRALAEAVRLCRFQKVHAVLVVEDSHLLAEPADRRALERLAHLDPNPAARVTVVQTVCTPIEGLETGEVSGRPDWQLAIRVPPLTRSETDRYVREKLVAAGRSEPAFTPRAVERIYERTLGVPRGIDRLGTLALMAGAARGLEVIGPEVVDGAVQECESPWNEFAA